eukprot:GHUV01052719.1.p1 GENE.GHUV01052719.1~~GHUV01052719.1.p1  ORF type:complete len:262 (+),score=46.06 GHUV01052719.1:496-1281(+)
MRVVHVVQPRAPYVCAHGGDTSNHPSNTAGAHTAAITEGFDCVEVDVSLTADHQLILLHNRDLRQLTGRTDAMVHEFPLEHLLQLTWQTGEPPLTVSQAVAATAPHVDLVVLDVKTSALPRLVTAPNGSTVSEEAFIAQLLLELLSAAGHNNTLIWGKSDTVVEHVKQSVPAQLAGYTVMMDHTGSAPHFEDPLRTRMKHVEVSQVFAASSCTATWLCCVACCPVPWCLLEHMLLHSMQPLQGLPSGTSHLGMPLPLGVNA